MIGAMAQRERIVLKLRELILAGELAPGQRVAEIPVATLLGVSRTPVRHALAVLAQEGLLVSAGARGYVVRAFTLKDIEDAIELRGMLEGMAARLAVERGLDPTLLERLRSCLAEGEAILEATDRGAADDSDWAAMNQRFHRLIVEASSNQALTGALALNDKVPFASAHALLGGDADDPALLGRHREILRHAQVQHRTVVEALARGQGARVEALMREHALVARDNIVLFRKAIPSLVEAPEKRPRKQPVQAV